jgi:Flp pilus assembly protein TadD
VAESKTSPSNGEAQALLQQGLGHHQAGRLEEAESCYREILQTWSDHADANHLLGVIALQAGQLEIAIELISKAITRNPKVADYHNNLGLLIGPH